jgi:hypothetical protein
MPGWMPTGNLNTPRYTHTATELPNGTVLVHAGRTFTATSTTFLSTSELFDPGTGTWAPTGSATWERTQHSAVLLRNGKVLVVGGDVRQPSLPPGGTELYNPATGRWEYAGTLNFPRDWPAVTPLSDGRVLVAGGGYPGENPTVPRTAEIYDGGAWVPTGSLVFGRSLFTATLLTSGLVLVVGGVGFDDEAAKTCELYEPAAGRWRLTGVLGHYRLAHTATRLNDGTVLVAGGVYYTAGSQYPTIAATEIWDPTTELWSSVGPLNEARANHTATLLPDGSSGRWRWTKR